MLKDRLKLALHRYPSLLALTLKDGNSRESIR